MSVVTRFAPSPTGRLHVGNIRTALHNYLFARKNGGQFILRIDDTDRERSNAEFDQAIRDDLDWLGLTPDSIARQSERFELYERDFQQLKAAGRVYACYETPEELDLRRKVLLGRGLPPVYERKPADGPISEGRAPHWRFRLDHDSPIVWNDLIRGEQRFDPKLLSDPVVRREDGSWLYLLPSVIDDVDLGITHVVRGEDHVSNSAAQIQMFEALGAEPPQFAHEALLVAAEGKLSKRLGSYGTEHVREEGVEPIALLDVLARIGTSQPVEPIATLGELADTFDFSTFGRAPAHFDPHEVELVNARLLHKLDYSEVADRLPAGASEEDWLLLRPNLERLSDFASWFDVVHGDLDAPELAHDERLLVKDAAVIAETLDWSGEAWRQLTDELKSSTGKKGRELF
ncbi:MAG: glutamate--tRNA ligase, partial [Sphingomicrobium sp.]